MSPIFNANMSQIAQKNVKSAPMRKLMQIICQKGAGTKMHKCFVGTCPNCLNVLPTVIGYLSFCILIGGKSYIPTKKDSTLKEH